MPLQIETQPFQFNNTILGLSSAVFNSVSAVSLSGTFYGNGSRLSGVIPIENFFSLVSGYLTIEDLSPIATGEVIKYTYTGGAIRYRFIANDDSLDAFYLNYENGVFSNLVTTKRITI